MSERHNITTRTGMKIREDSTEGAAVVAFCSCGWVGQEMPTQAKALIDGDEHVLAII